MRLSVLGILCLGLMVALSPALYGGDTDQKIPDAKKTLKSVTKSMKKSTAKSNFNVTCAVRGGMSRSKDHQISALSVSQDYDADVYRGIMYASSLDAYRNPKKGAIRGPKAWHDALATKEGVLFTRLMNFPHLLLETALSNPKSVEWVWVGDELEEEETDEIEEETEGHTTVVKREQKEAGWKGMPHLIRVQMNPKVALTQFNETVNNSNCVGGG